MAEAITPPGYAELHALSNFSFQRGASHPEELVERAHALGYSALAVTDACSIAGVVRAHVRARELKLHLIIGAEFRVQAPALGLQGFTLVLLAKNRSGHAQLCEFITHARRRDAPHAREQGPGLERLPVHLDWQDNWPPLPTNNLLALLAPWRDACPTLPEATLAHDLDALGQWLHHRFPQRGWLAAELHGQLDDAHWAQQLAQAAQRKHLKVVASGNVHMHQRARKPLQDVLTAVRLGQPLQACGLALQPNAERHLRHRKRLAQIHPPGWLAESLHIAQQCTFNLDELRYEYPEEVVPQGETPASHLRQLTLAGAHRRYPLDLPGKVARLIEKELALIGDLGYEKYFLTVYDLVNFARQRGILCQGRGSAANSAVCYCLGITEVDPDRGNLLFERFISRERNEPPDIDVDFEHHRREEVIQYLYLKYGRERAALTATVITYRERSALRDVTRAFGLDPAALTAEHPRWAQIQTLVDTLKGFPRHLSQHTGGFVLTGDRLTSTVPVVPAAMAGRTTIEWDKDDIDALGLLKVDVLALGMLSALQQTLQMVGQRHGRTLTLADIPPEDPATYDMICAADTVGVFQIESRAQMSMLPRLRPRNYYDLVVEVAIVRPGPIQGGMVHPYLKARERQRQGLPLELPNEALRPALKRTLGVPIFQEQVMQIAMIAADFTPGEADALRRSMAAWRRKGGVDRFRDRLIGGMQAKGYPQDFAEAIFRQIEGFGEYGFPESHAASFALLVYASAWLKRHEPACFLVALLNAQPMGFYAPAQLVQDARRHGVTVHPVDVLHSGWHSGLESGTAHSPQPQVRLGLHLVKGLSKDCAGRIAQARSTHAPASVDELARLASLAPQELRLLAEADALRSLSGHRRQQVWQASALNTPAPPLLREAPVHEEACPLPPPPEGEDVLFDYTSLGLTLRSHPLALLRPRLERRRLQTAQALQALPHGRLVRACGLVTARQRPGTAKGVVFVTLEDETGTVQVIVWPRLRERLGRVLVESRLLAVHGQWQREGEVCHLVAGHLADLTPLLGDLPTRSRDFR
jgi:error-prone DNA polymerase